jgi:Predicted membrane protein
VLVIELLGIRSLAFAVGSYLSIATSMAIFAGGVVRWLAERGLKDKSAAESEVSPGSLYASGLIAAGGIMGLFAIVMKVLEARDWVPKDMFLIGPSVLGSLTQASWLSVVMFFLLGFSLFTFARKKMD